MFDEQLNSFLTKFSQLRRAGFTAHLDLDTCAGKSWVGLRVMLGPDQNHNSPNVKRRSPSYFRRQERRKAARAAAEQSILSGDVTAAEAFNKTNDDTAAATSNNEEQEKDNQVQVQQKNAEKEDV